MGCMPDNPGVGGRRLGLGAGRLRCVYLGEFYGYLILTCLKRLTADNIPRASDGRYYAIATGFERDLDHLSGEYGLFAT